MSILKPDHYFDSAIIHVTEWREVLRVLKPGGHLLSYASTTTYHRTAIAIEDAGFEIRDQIGWLSDTWMSIVLARKPFDGTVASNILTYGCGGLNIDGCRVSASPHDIALARVPQPAFNSPTGKIYGMKCGEGRNGAMFDMASGRWPANIIHDGSAKTMDAFAAYGNRGASAPVQGHEASTTGQNGIYGHFERVPGTFYSDSGSAARFFHCALSNNDLMRYLCKLVTPIEGIILAGSALIKQAAIEEGFRAILLNQCIDKHVQVHI